MKWRIYVLKFHYFDSSIYPSGIIPSLFIIPISSIYYCCSSISISLMTSSLTLSSPISAPSAICTSSYVSSTIPISTRQNGSGILF